MHWRFHEERPIDPTRLRALFWPPARRCTTLCVADFLVPTRTGPGRRWCTAPGPWVFGGRPHHKRADVAVFVHAVFDALFGFGRSRQLGGSRFQRPGRLRCGGVWCLQPREPWLRWRPGRWPLKSRGYVRDGNWVRWQVDRPEFATTGQDRDALEELNGGD